MKIKHFVLGSLAGLVFLGTGCAKNDMTTNVSTSTLREHELNVRVPQDNQYMNSNRSTTTVTEPEYNTPILREKEPDYAKNSASYFFIVENKNNNLGNTSEYGILSVRKNCETFGIIQLTKNQPLNLSPYKDRPILWKQYELHDGEYTLREIAEDTTPQQEIENFKKTCSQPFEKYMGLIVAHPGVHLYVESLEESSKNILNAIKAIHVVEYKPSELSNKNQINTFFFTVPNDMTSQFEALLHKEANDGNVYGAKSLWGGFSEIERAEHGTRNFEIKLISVALL